jgi:hypothetical protein
MASGIADIWTDVAPTSTFEGVNVVMNQQSSRYLLKQAKRAASGKKCEGYFRYVNHLDELCNSKSEARTLAEFSSLEHLEKVMMVNSAAQLRHTYELLSESDAVEVVKQNDLFADEVQRLSTLHIKFLLFVMARERIEETKFVDPKIKSILNLIIRIYALKELIKDN